MPPTSVFAAEPTTPLPDHKQLPEKDGNFVRNFQEQPQSEMLTGSLLPRFRECYPDGQYLIGTDSGIYWRYMQPVLAGCKSPDWYLIPGVPPSLNGEYRRSYVLWQEGVRPLIVIEYVSGDGSEERDTTPHTGKFWVYEKGIAATYYAIFEAEKDSVEVYCQSGNGYRLMTPTANGRYLIEPWGVELGIWQGSYRGITGPWLRVWDAATGLLMPHFEEQVESALRQVEDERERAETAEGLIDDFRHQVEEESERAETERKRAELLAERLRALGVDPDAPQP